MCGKIVKPFNTHNLLYYYVPVQGVLSYTALSINVMNPCLVLRIFPRKDATNILLMNSLLGTGLYLYGRPHIKDLPQRQRLIYSTFGSVTFSLGSVLIWAILRSLIPENIPLCTLAAIGTSATLLKIGSSYSGYVDSLASKTKENK